MRSFLATAMVCGCLALACEVRAACNLIPGTAQSFDAVVGATNRPFAAPGEPVEVRTRPCDAPAVLTANAADHVVTVLFEPRAGGPRHAAVLTANADCAAFDLASCQGQLGPGAPLPLCVTGATAGLEVVEPNGVRHLRFRFPDTDPLVDLPDDRRTLAGPATIAVTAASNGTLPCALATTSCREQSGLITCVDDFFANADGSCSTLVAATTFPGFTALPPANDYRNDCFTQVPPCTPAFSEELRAATDRQGNVLIPMDWSGVLVRQNGVPIPRLLRASFDPIVPFSLPGRSFTASFTPEGGLLPPIFEPQFDTSTASQAITTLFGSVDAPYTILRVARRSEVFRRCSGGANDLLACNVAEDCPGACSAGVHAGNRCGTDGDCPGGVCGPPGTCGQTICYGGSRNGQACNADRNCPLGECGPSNFDLEPLAEDGVGPIVLDRFLPRFCQDAPQDACGTNAECSLGSACVAYAFEASNPVPLEGLVQDDELFAFAINEGVDDVDRNGDAPDRTDTVVTLRSRETGAIQPLGAPIGCGLDPQAEGRAVIRLQQPPFSFPAVATEGERFAFLESEPNQNNCDLNGDGDTFDAILRVFELGPAELTAGSDIAADGALRINGRSLALSNSLVFFRAPEGAAASRQTRRANELPGGVESAAGGNLGVGGLTNPISADGRYVVFNSLETGFFPGAGGKRDIFVRDLWTDTVELASLSTGGTISNLGSIQASISANGRFVVFATPATNLFPGDAPNDCTQPTTENCFDVVLRDRCVDDGMAVPGCTPATELVSQSSSGVHGNNHSFEPQVSGDGRYVAFTSAASNLVDGDTNTCASSILAGVGPCPDIFVRDRCLANGVAVPGCSPSTVRASVGSDGLEGNGQNLTPALSDDGRVVAFWSFGDLHPDDAADNSSDIYARDLDLGVTELVSRTYTGAKAGGANEFASISADGRYVAFETTGDNMVPGETDGGDDAFVRDRLLQTTELISIGWDGSPTTGGGGDGVPTLSGDGRYVAFLGAASNLVPDDSNGVPDWFVRDRVMGVTERITVSSAGAQTSGSVPAAYLSHDGRFAVFDSDAADLLDGSADGNGVTDVFVRGIDLADAASDASGDGDLDDILLAVLDTDAPAPTPVLVCPAELVAVAGGRAAFLRPEAAGAAPLLPLCAGGPDLNADGDTDDLVVSYLASPASPLQNLQRAAVGVDLAAVCRAGAKAGAACGSDLDCPESICDASFVAALVSEAGQNDAQLNGDGDTDDAVVQVHRVSDPPSGWTNTGQAADAMKASGGLVTFLSPEAAQGAVLNGDGDLLDRVLQVWDLGAAKLTNTRQAAAEFVVGARTGPCGDSPLVAFRTSEAAQGGADLNGDGDAVDDVLQTYAKGLGVRNSGQAVLPCRLEACDPQLPYRVLENKVKFLTLEAAQGSDLNQDGDELDLILQQFEACTQVVEVVGTADDDYSAPGDPEDDDGGRVRDPLTDPQPDESDDASFVTEAGRCVAGMETLLVPATCSADADCPAGATCAAELVDAAPGSAPRHDTVLLPIPPVTMRIGATQAFATRKLRIKVRNGDLLPARELPGHLVRLSVFDGTCPDGTVVGLPDLDSSAPGVQETAVLAGGRTRTATVELFVDPAAFTTFNAKAPERCTLEIVASAVEPENQDPTPANNVQRVDLDVVDFHDAAQATAHESAIGALRTAKVTIAKNAAAGSRTVRVKLTNADLLPSPEPGGHSIALVLAGGDCPSETLALPPPQNVAGGATVVVPVVITAATADFRSAGPKSPARCTAVLRALTGVPANVEPESSNDEAQLVIDVVDRND